MRAELDSGERREVDRKARVAILDRLAAAGGEVQRQALLRQARGDAGFTERELEAEAPVNAREKYASFVDYRLSWTLSNLKREGLLENPRWSVWRLSDVGRKDAPHSVAEPVPAERLQELRAMPWPAYLRTPEWRRTRAEALARADRRCALDSSHTEHLEVHHNTYERVGAELASDLVVLCRDCHRLHHRVNGRPRRPPEAPGVVATGSIGPPQGVPAPERQAKPSLLRRLLGR